MRQFSGGYKKNTFDKQQEQKAAKATQEIAAKHRAEIKAIEDAAFQAEIDAGLRAAAARFNALLDKDQPKKKKKNRKTA